jgi:UDP-N-acetylglucosamine acyltransferase
MGQSIHSTAIVAKTAQLGNNVSIGAYTIIEDDVVIGDNVEIRSHCIIGAHAQIGNNNIIHASTIIGTEPQDAKFEGELAPVKIGDNNIIREFVTINNGTKAAGGTIVGNNNMLLAYSHVAHDCILGNHIVMSNLVHLGGHVRVEDWVVFGGYSKVHQFVEIGCHAMISADATVVKDVSPYVLLDRTPAVRGLNRIGLSRRGFSQEIVKELSTFYKYVFHSGLNNADGIKKYLADKNNIISPEVQHCIDFITHSERGVIR